MPPRNPSPDATILSNATGDYQYYCDFSLLIRNGVGDTRLEAKVTKKKPRPRTALPRTDPLEAKDRIAQGPKTQAQVSVLQNKKKKGPQKDFSGDLRKKRSSKIFSSHLQNFNDSKNCAVLEARTGQFSRT